MKPKFCNVRWLTGVALALGLAANAAVAQDTFNAPRGQQIPPPACFTIRGAWEGGYVPCTPASHRSGSPMLRTGAWSGAFASATIRRAMRCRALKWTQSSFMQPQMMVHDRYFYDPVAAQYTVDRYLDDLDKRYGGIDAVLIWSTYPNMGIDDRNQLDMVRSMPGGVEGVRKMVDDFHRRGVRVLFPMMMWDQGTRDPDALARCARGADEGD